MKVLVFLNMPAGNAAVSSASMEENTGFLTHQIILDMPGVTSLEELAFEMASRRIHFLYGDHMIYERVGREKVWKNRGPMIINMAHVGKIAPYYEGGR